MDVQLWQIIAGVVLGLILVAFAAIPMFDKENTRGPQQ